MKKRQNDILDFTGAILIALSVQHFIFHVLRICQASESVLPLILA
jgi:hypothetical protein